MVTCDLKSHGAQWVGGDGGEELPGRSLIFSCDVFVFFLIRVVLDLCFSFFFAGCSMFVCFICRRLLLTFFSRPCFRRLDQVGVVSYFVYFLFSGVFCRFKSVCLIFSW